ncbi:MAG: ABC transporter ATP-binding protein [Acidimicrobiales bacterium]
MSELTAGYGRVTVLHGVSLEAACGEVLGIAGANGAGKTTLLNAIAGLGQRCSGDVRIGDVALGDQPAHVRVARGLALVPEGRQVIGAITVKANLDITVMARGRLRTDSEHRERIADVLELFPALRSRLDVPGSVLSGGEQQMLAVARALMTKPKVLLLDEPSQGLSPSMVAIVVEALQKLRGSVTVVLVEQNPNVLGALSDRTLTLSLGRIAGEVP